MGQPRNDRTATDGGRLTVFAQLEADIRGVVIPTYAGLGQLSCAYALGSLVEGLTDRADLDMVLVWESLPFAGPRPPLGLADDSPAPQVFDEPGFVLDRFWFRGQEVDAKHVTVAEFEGWVGAVEDGTGTRGYPMPVIAVHGLLSGVVLWDPSGLAAGTRERLQEVPPALMRSTALAFRAGRPEYDRELAGCVERDDGLLFHSLAAESVRAAFLAWFTAQGLYWPHEKRLGRRLVDLGRADLAEAEAKIWSAHNLGSTLAAYQQLYGLIEPEVNERGG